MAFPHLSQLQHKHRAQGLTVVGVCLEEDGPQTRGFVAQQACAACAPPRTHTFVLLAWRNLVLTGR